MTRLERVLAAATNLVKNYGYTREAAAEGAVVMVAIYELGGSASEKAIEEKSNEILIDLQEQVLN